MENMEVMPVIKNYLLTPGPVEVPEKALEAGTTPMINHRCARFSSLFEGIEEKLGTLLSSRRPVVILPSSGTGALECAAVNFLREGDTFISLSCGVFGRRFREIAQRTGAKGVFVDAPEGSAPTPRDAAEAVAAHPEARALLITHNETSTGVTVPIKNIIAALPQEKRPLVLVDGVSAVGAIECLPEEWGIDVLCTASQKGLLTPPGLGFVWLSERARAALDDRECRSYYFDLKLQYKYMKPEGFENPYTPPVSLYYTLNTSLDLILEHGAQAWFAERKKYATDFASALECMGYELFVSDPKLRSPGLTAFSAPNGASNAVRAYLSSHGVETAGGQASMKGKLIRAAHYGRRPAQETEDILTAFANALREVQKQADGR